MSKKLESSNILKFNNSPFLWDHTKLTTINLPGLEKLGLLSCRLFIDYSSTLTCFGEYPRRYG